MKTNNCIELPVVHSSRSKIEVLFTSISEIHGVYRTDNDQQCVVLHGPTAAKWLIAQPYKDVVYAVYGVPIV